MIRLAVVILLGGWAAHGQEADDPDVESAKRHFARAMQFYDAGDYPRALPELEAARVVHPSPALDYNIGRCLDRMERFSDAIVAYQRYVDARPTPSDAPAVRERIAKLHERLALTNPQPPETNPPPAAPRPSHKRAVLWGVLGGVVVVGVSLGVGLGVGLSSTRDPSPTWGHWMLRP